MSIAPRRFYRTFGQRPADRHFKQLKLTIPLSLYEKLKEFSEITDAPMNRLVCYAIDNELGNQIPFIYNTQLPHSEYVEGAYAGEAQKLGHLLRDFSDGTSKDMLLLLRREMGIEAKKDVLHGIRELLKSGFYTEAMPKKAEYMKINPEFKHIKLKKMADTDKLLRQKERQEKTLALTNKQIEVSKAVHGDDNESEEQE